MVGFHVTRRFGWDCHGVPVEFEVVNQFGIGKPVENPTAGQVSIAEYNQRCREIVMRYSEEWRQTVNRMGRWIDFENDYKTMNASFMESVWWAFNQLFQRGLVYKGFKVMPFSTALHTPLSNFEAGQNYKDVKEPAITVGFKLLDSDPSAKPAFVLAWTTTPWTLPSNLALCVNTTFDYIRVPGLRSDPKNPKAPKIPTGVDWILAKDRLSEYFTPEEVESFASHPTFKGADMVGWKYEPLFPFFATAAAATAFRVISGDFVEAGSGTGIVHCAPFFGEDDNAV
jgi:isoleucyl-tRNA synthetase